MRMRIGAVKRKDLVCREILEDKRYFVLGKVFSKFTAFIFSGDLINTALAQLDVTTNGKWKYASRRNIERE